MSTQLSLKQAYHQKLEANLEMTEAKLAELKAKAKNAKADARINFDKQLDGLEQQIHTTKAKLKELDEASEDAWEQLKDSVGSAWDELSTGMKKAVSKLNHK